VSKAVVTEFFFVNASCNYSVVIDAILATRKAFVAFFTPFIIVPKVFKIPPAILVAPDIAYILIVKAMAPADNLSKKDASLLLNVSKAFLTALMPIANLLKP
jgi:hypothetical protein